MSGFEIVGVVLGVWPVVMTAVTVYKASKDDRGAERLRVQLDTEEFIFRRFVHDLLSSDVTEADLVQLSDRNRPNTGLWKDKGLHAKLEARLGPASSSIVLSTLREMDKLLSSLRDKLASLNTDPKGSRAKLKASMSHIKHIRPSSSFRQDLETLKWHNVQLTRLFTNCTSPGYAAQGKQPNGPPALSPEVLKQNSAHANELYDAICDSYHCQCSSPHEANLGLRPDSPKLKDASEPFELIFPTKDASEYATEMETKCASPSEISSIGGPTELGSSTEPTWDSYTSQQSRRWSYSRTNSVSPSPPREKQCRPVSLGSSKSSLIDIDEASLIPDLCKFVQDLDDATATATATRGSSSCLGVLGANEKKYTVKIRAVEGESTAQQQPHSVVCLDDCLVPGAGWQLSRRTRMDLALSLSLAILQFYATPWIDGWWTWKDFSMLKEEKSQVFISRKFYSAQSPHVARLASHSASTSAFWEICGEPVLTRLGFALVELALGKRLSQLRPVNEDQMIDEDMLDLLTAKSVVKSGRVLDEAGQVYSDAVQACLEHQVVVSEKVMGLKSEHKNFQQDLEELVVGPLRNFHAASWPQVY